MAGAVAATQGCAGAPQPPEAGRQPIVVVAATKTPADSSTDAPTEEPTDEPAEEKARSAPECVRVRGAAACVGGDDSLQPGVSVEDTENDRLHPAVEYYLNGYLGTMYSVHNLARQGEVRGSPWIGDTITYRAALYKGDHRLKVSEWKTLKKVTKNPVARETGISPATAQARARVCTSTRGRALVCFTGKKTTIFACDTGTDRRQVHAEYYIGGDPTARFEIHQLAGPGTCGKAVHGRRTISKYRASLFDGDHRIGDALYKYN
ncbi:hypothetical protein [Spongiactinospora sp. TRM90649]|uniref:hypothetical protein n=1 Tax=Spongiactinospora sp. TRM90649 TaxID=3031114 RepID=UPI0023F958E9|nr:hypothetical protein [Spongiactinospora sp. TRM90649]MDF5755281.1 hypothetical protein [Spongiactinospora sp. TRM90649]